MRGQHIVFRSVLLALQQPDRPFRRSLKQQWTERLQSHAGGELHQLCDSRLSGLASQEAHTAGVDCVSEEKESKC